MLVREIADTLGARLLCCQEALDKQVRSACGSDLMSDVLAFVKDHTVLLTGLVSNQALRTAQMLDVTCIVFVRGKTPPQEIVEMAQELEIPLMSTRHTMYEACGMLYAKGLPGVPR